MTVDFSPVVVPLVQAAGLVVSALAIPFAWYLINWIRSKMKLSQIGEDDAMRAVINQGLQKSIGVGVSRINEAVAGKPMTADIKNQVISNAVEYALKTIPDALKAFQLDTPEKVAAAIEARLGIMEMQTTTGQSAPAVPTATAPTAGNPSSSQ